MQPAKSIGDHENEEDNSTLLNKKEELKLPPIKSASNHRNSPLSNKYASPNQNQIEEEEEGNLDIEEENKELSIKAPRGAVSNGVNPSKTQKEEKAPMINKPQIIPPADPYAKKTSKDGGGAGGKFQEFLIAEKQRKFIRVPRLYGKRDPMLFKCPYCKNEKETRTRLKHECTGNQWCMCITCCFFGCYPICCVPFCFKRCYNVKHLCPNCQQQVGESGL